ncbi:hypothetical protein ACH4S9_11995 [Streptomyces sp. NPDC021225]|uniref:hypothetical protein n=1 Tax=Streptomyces sp. NPDC021225 TaxID=3365121 RepID=UPI0037927345
MNHPDNTWYTAADKPELVTFGPVHGLGVTGQGEPGGASTASASEQGLERAGTHHEIYLSDVRESDPAKMRTILRQPVRPV